LMPESPPPVDLPAAVRHEYEPLARQRAGEQEPSPGAATASGSATWPARPTTA
jgi:hypothetical protein